MKKMKNSIIKKTIDFIKTEKRLCLAAFFVVATFFVCQALYSSQKITSKNCASGECAQTLAEKPQLSKGNGFFYLDEILKNNPPGYYRLAFKEKSDKGEKIIIKINTYSEKEDQIGELTLDPSDNFQDQEIFFSLPDGFENILFQKEDSSGPANIFIKNVGISRLNIKSLDELAGMKKTVMGETKTNMITESQGGVSADFPWLKDSKTEIGQIFQAQSDYNISSISLAMDVIRDLNSSSRQYVLSLREANYDGEKISSAGPIIDDVLFSVQGMMEKYRQGDGTFLFPLFGHLEKGKHYMLILDNSKVDVNDRNYLSLKGDKNENSYPNGSALIKKLGQLTKIDGDLFFQIHGVDLYKENGTAILDGAKIEDLGGGVGGYSYKTAGDYSDLFNLSNFSPGTSFNSNYNVIFAPAQNNSNFSYAINTLYPISRINFSATQARSVWKNVKVAYSFDQIKWIDMPFSRISEDIGSESSRATNNMTTSDSETDDSSGNNSDGNSPDNTSPNSGDPGNLDGANIQSFDFNIMPTDFVNTVYFKITYDPNDNRTDANYFGVKDLSITADLKMKK